MTQLTDHRYYEFTNPKIRTLRCLSTDDRGAALILAAAAIPVMLMLTVIIIDLGMAQVMRAQLQAALDAAALAAVRDGTVAEVRVERQDVTDWNLFVTDDQLPDELDLIPFPDGEKKHEKWHMETYQECRMEKDPDTGAETRVCEDKERRVRDGWYVNWIRRDQATRTVRPAIRLDPATDRAEEVLRVSARTWEKSLGRQFRNLQIDAAQIICEDPETGYWVTGSADCPNAGTAASVRVRYKILQGSVEYRTLLAGPVFRMVQGQAPDPWITIRLGDQEATLEFRRSQK